MKILKKVAAFAFLVAFFAQNLAAQTAADADAAFQIGMVDKATTIYESVVKAAPTDINAQLQLGNLYLAQGKPDKALAAFTKAATINAEDKLVDVANARIALLNGKSEESVKLINRSIKAAKNKNTNLLRQAGESYFFGKTKNYKRAAEMLEAANTSNTKDYATLMSLGWVNKELLEGGKSVTSYEFASDLDKSNAVPIYRIGQVYYQSRNFGKFEEFMKKAIAANPNFTPASRSLGDHYYRTNKITSAKKAYDGFVFASRGEVDDVSIEDRMQYANILFLNKDYEKLVGYVDEVIKMDGSRNYLRRLLGYAAYETGDYEKGMNIMTDYFAKVKPTEIIADDYEFYAKLLEKKGQDSVALLNYEKAITMDGKKWSLYKPAGKLAGNTKLKRYDDALKYFTINLDSLNAAVARGDEGVSVTAEDYYYLALGNEKIKNYVQADTLYAKVAMMSPTASTGWKSRARLQKKFFEPDVITDASLSATYGVSKPHYDKWLAVISAYTDPKDVEKYKKDFIEIYNEMVFYYSVKDNIPVATEWANKVLAIDPNNANIKSFFEQINGTGGSVPVPPLTPVPPTTPKGKG